MFKQMYYCLYISSLDSVYIIHCLNNCEILKTHWHKRLYTYLLIFYQRIISHIKLFIILEKVSEAFYKFPCV